jgi:hypothetical protein
MPRWFSVYQLGRGSAPVVVVSSALSLVTVNTLSTSISLREKPRCGDNLGLD